MTSALAPVAEPGIGHNSDAFQIARDDVAERVAGFLAGADVWDTRESFDDDLAQRATDFIAGLRKLATELEKLRRAECTPHENEVKAVNTWWKVQAAKLDKIKALVEPKLEAFLKRKREEAVAALAEAQRIAREQDEARRAAELQAASAATPSARIEAEARAEEASINMRAAEDVAERASAPVRVESATGLANRRGLRRVRTATVTSMTLALTHYLKTPTGREKLGECLTLLANADVRARGVDTPLADIKIPGVEITEEEKL